MSINPISISFKSANIEAIRNKQQNFVAQSPIAPQAKDVQTTPISSDYNVKVPLKYADLGEETLPCDVKAHLYKLENGQRVVIIPKQGPTVVKTYVNVGSMNEPDKVRGISHFIEHNLFNGSEGLEAGEFFATVNKMGANTNASTGFAATDYYIQSNLLKDTDLETEIKIHAEMLETPKFAQNMLDKEKGPVTSEINMILDDPENIAVNNTLKMLFNINSTSKDVIGGSVDNIKKLTRDDVVDYYKRNYYPANMVTVITGDVKPDEAIKLISKHFKSRYNNTKPRNYEKLTPIQKSERNDLISDKTNAAILSMGFAGPKNCDTKDKILLDAFQFFLVGSSVARLNRSLEEIQTNAFISSDRIGTRPQDPTVVLFSTQTADGNIENAINKVFSEVNDLAKNPPTDKELNIVKKKLKLNLAQVFESSSITNSTVGTAMLDNDLESVKQFENVIDNLTAKDIVDFSKKYFDLNKVAITVVHPASANLKSINQNYERVHHISFGHAPSSVRKEAIDSKKVNQYSMNNGISLTTNDNNKDLVAIDFSLQTDAPANVKPGVSELLAIMLNKGSKFTDEKKFFTNLESQGVQASFSARESEIYANSMFLPSDAKFAMKEIKEVMLSPRFTEKDLATAKVFLRESIQNNQKSSEEGLLKEMFKDQFYGTTSQEILNNINNISLDDVKALYQYIMNNAEGRIVASGPFEKNPELQNELISSLSQDFQTFKTPDATIFSSYKPIEDKTVVIQEHNKSQAEIQMGYKYKTSGNLKDSISFNLLNIILGGTASSRLFSDLREKQKLAYQVNSGIKNFDNAGVISLFIKTTTDDAATGATSYDNLQKSVEGFKKHVDLMKNENVTEQELESAKLTLKNKILDYSELTADKNLSLLIGKKSFYGALQDNKILEAIDSITADDIKAASNYIFSTNPTISIVATKNTIENNKKYLETQGKIIEM